jgi:signal transduction histidine kinase
MTTVVTRDRSLQRTIDVLVRFSHIVSEATGGREIIPHLVNAAVDQVGADGALVIEVTDGGHAKIAAMREVPEALWTRHVEVDAIDATLGSALLTACGGRFGHVHTLPMVSSGGLFGVLVLLFSTPDSLDARHIELARGLVDLAAIALGKGAQATELAESRAKVRASQDVLQRTEKLRSLGQMAAGLSHDLKNVLNPLSLQLQGAQRAPTKGNVASTAESIDAARVTLRRAAEMLERLRDFSRQSPEAKLEQIDLNHIVHEAVELARPQMASRGGGRLSAIRVEPGTPQRILARPGEVLSAIVNLVVNAIDAMPEGGTITVRTGEADGKAWVQVADDGPGMTAELRQKVFEPFFTTKGADGTGLGLAMVFACMERQGGSVSLESEPGAGAKFTLRFPSDAPPPPSLE